jgi:hypothetical protein
MAQTNIWQAPKEAKLKEKRSTIKAEMQNIFYGYYYN